MSARQRILKRITEERRGAASTRGGSIDSARTRGWREPRLRPCSAWTAVHSPERTVLMSSERSGICYESTSPDRRPLEEGRGAVGGFTDPFRHHGHVR